jgi:hypothetical protein
VAPCTSPAPNPTSDLRASDPALVSQLLEVIVPEITK